MKFAISAVVMLALTMGVQSSLYAGIPGILGAHSGLAAPWLAAPHIPAAVNILGSPILHAPFAAHAPLAAHIPAAVAVAPHAAHVAAIPTHGATYVAKTRGAVHTAPLPGHVHSAASVNLAPAPGTW